jgi:hypothetical protein
MYGDYMTTTTTRSKNPVIDTMLRQIGWGNVAAISGLRWKEEDELTVSLPVRHGYSVEVYLAPDDTYTVARVLTRRPKATPGNWAPDPVRTVKGIVVGVYADQVGDVAYRASCYRDPFGGQR